jgi:hypothetical protein
MNKLKDYNLLFGVQSFTCPSNETLVLQKEMQKNLSSTSNWNH